MQVCKEVYCIHPMKLMLHLYFNQADVSEYVLSIQDYSLQKVK